MAKPELLEIVDESDQAYEKIKNQYRPAANKMGIGQTVSFSVKSYRGRYAIYMHKQ